MRLTAPPMCSSIFRIVSFNDCPAYLSSMRGKTTRNCKVAPIARNSLLMDSPALVVFLTDTSVVVLNSSVVFVWLYDVLSLVGIGVVFVVGLVVVLVVVGLGLGLGVVV